MPLIEIISNPNETLPGSINHYYSYHHTIKSRKGITYTSFFKPIPLNATVASVIGYIETVELRIEEYRARIKQISEEPIQPKDLNESDDMLI